MNTTEFESIQRKIETLKEKQARASGTIEAAEKQLTELGVEDIDNVDTFLVSLESEVHNLEEKSEADYVELKGLYAWQFV